MLEAIVCGQGTRQKQVYSCVITRSVLEGSASSMPVAQAAFSSVRGVRQQALRVAGCLGCPRRGAPLGLGARIMQRRRRLRARRCLWYATAVFGSREAAAVDIDIVHGSTHVMLEDQVLAERGLCGVAAVDADVVHGGTHITLEDQVLAEPGLRRATAVDIDSEEMLGITYTLPSSPRYVVTTPARKDATGSEQKDDTRIGYSGICDGLQEDQCDADLGLTDEELEGLLPELENSGGRVVCCHESLPLDPKSVTFRAIVDFACEIIVPAQRGEWFLLSEMLQWIQEEKGAERPEELALASALSSPVLRTCLYWMGCDFVPLAQGWRSSKAGYLGQFEMHLVIGRVAELVLV